MAHKNYTPSTLASAMQLKTRKEKKFDEIESRLGLAKSSTIPLAQGQSRLTGWLNRFNLLQPFAKPATDNDIVWLLDNTAYKSTRTGTWQAEFVAAVFEREDKETLMDMVTGVIRAVGLADDAAERDTVEERVLPFLWDIRPATIVTASQNSKELKLGPTNINGLTSNMLKISSGNSGLLVKASTKIGGGRGSIIKMQTYYAGEDGWGIISDIDDTIKVTMTSDPVGILRETFINSPAPIPGMPELYTEIKSFLPKDTAWFYLSASPYNLYPFLKQFRKQYYPPGTLILRDSSWKTVAGLLSALTLRTEEYKVDRMKKINRWLPRRKMIVIGDSTQSDPEAYGEMYRIVPGWIRLILIRKATDVAAVGIDEKNEPERFEKAFKDIPRDAWHVFEDPKECVEIIKKTIQREH
ncbi:actin filament organization protein App1-like protein [Metarhizium guizhouense ARSEF 977]|uniref:Actin filament organization protein App1-like protein n=1 Tax=Metarhizium guizhouense (strain ARSEF 977) TaxID=1276136 RepID=A0A0B4HFY2_METGA|nr:actin filament organization protein App1-like protein [Metarhizium guizhouense ARSEF 977]